MSPLLFVYVTFPSAEEATDLATTLLDEGLIACANLLPEMTSLYRWEGRIQQESEVVLILKTLATELEALKARILALHSYDTPCIAALPVSDASQDFVAWVREQVAE